MTTKELKMAIIWLAGIMILFYWMAFAFTNKRPEMIFQLAVTLLVAEKTIDLRDWIYGALNYKGFERRKDSDEG